MVGQLPRAPHHDLIQYLNHMQFNTMGSKLGCYKGNRVEVVESDV